MPMADNGIERLWTRARVRTRQGKLSSCTRAARAATQVQGANRGGSTWLTADQGTAMEARRGGGGGGGKAFGIMTDNEASPLPLNKALRKLTSLWSNFAIIAKFALRLKIKTMKRKYNLI